MRRRKHLFSVPPISQERKYGVFAKFRSADGQQEGEYHTTGKSHAELLVHVGMFLAAIGENVEVEDLKFERIQ